MKGQKGQVLILAMILLAVAALVIVPALSIMYSAMKSQGISEKALATLSTDDSALRVVLAQLKNQLMGTFTPGNPSTVFDFVYGGTTYHSTIQIPTVPTSQDMATGAMKALMITAEPPWFESTANGTNYVIRIGTQPWNATTGTYEYTLPLGFTYAPNSAYYWGPEFQNTMTPDAEINHTTHEVWLFKTGIWQQMNPGVGANPLEYINQGDPPPGGYLENKSYLVVTTLPDGRQRVKFKPYYTSTGGNRSLVTSIHANGSAWGVHYLEQGSLTLGSDTVTFTQTAAIGVSMYVIVITIGGVNYQVTIAWDSTTGTFKIISYQQL